MVSDFYRRQSVALLFCCLVLLPVLTFLGDQVSSNNDIETWLPRNSEIRDNYDRFCDTFGRDETILIAFEKPFPEAARLQAASDRLTGLPGISVCWTRRRVVESMLSNQVEQTTANERLVNLLTTAEDDLETMLVSINEHGIAHRSQTVAALRGQLAYCDMDNAILAGGPIVATQLDHLGSRKQSSFLFSLTLVICLVLLRLNIGCWKTSAGLMLANVFCIEMMLSAIWAMGYEMNFLMSSLPVMVMVFTTAAAIHFIGHYRHEYPDRDAVGRALSGVIRPSSFAALTTIIGLACLAVSDVGPIPAFGAVAAVGTFFSFIVGVFLTPAVLVALRYKPSSATLTQERSLQKLAMSIVNRPWQVMLPGLAITAVCAIGLQNLKSLIDPLEFLPEHDRVVQDTRLVARTLTSPTSIEAVVDFGQAETSFVHRLRRIRDIEAVVTDVPNICHALSLADFFPDELSENTLSLPNLAASSGSTAVGGLMADGSRLWRISLRVEDDSPAALKHTVSALKARCADIPVSFTGIGPLLENAQGQIFDGFWKSFASAFVLITVVMVIALRSFTAGLVAMIPNLTPILLVFGTLGWCDYPIDIGIMMTASIALGLAVDGTFHFLFSYRDARTLQGCRYRAVRKALLQTGMPIISSAVISGTGLLALGLSPFRPTMRFGVLMFCLLIAALVGDLILLPAFLAIGSRRKRLSRKTAVSEHKTSRVAA
ncbi:MAG: MMPL family transporter [Fuerstiella sp.]|nr:MMPL family transporter [Fuerstiella sp.]